MKSSNLFKNSEVDIVKFAALLVGMIAIVTICVYTEEYIIPFIIAMIVWFIIHELRENIQMIPFMKKYCPMWLQSLIGLTVIVVVLVLIGQLLYASVMGLMGNLEEYQTNLDIVMFQVSAMLNVDVMGMVSSYTANMDTSSIISSTVGMGTDLMANSFLILLYVLFLLIEESIFPEKLKALFNKQDDKYDGTQSLFQKMDKNISRYLSLKTLVSFMTGLLSYFAFLIFGLDAPIFWAMLIFVLNYIPTIGSLIATIFPAVFAILQFGELAPFVYILIVVGVIQVVIGNVVEPALMGTSLNMSSLVVVLSLTIWGAIWGIMGMILSVPITVMMIIVFEEIPALRPIAILLSEKGKLNVVDEDGEMPEG